MGSQTSPLKQNRSFKSSHKRRLHVEHGSRNRGGGGSFYIFIVVVAALQRQIYVITIKAVLQDIRNYSTEVLCLTTNLKIWRKIHQTQVKASKAQGLLFALCLNTTSIIVHGGEKTCMKSCSNAGSRLKREILLPMAWHGMVLF